MEYITLLFYMSLIISILSKSSVDSYILNGGKDEKGDMIYNIKPKIEKNLQSGLSHADKKIPSLREAATEFVEYLKNVITEERYNPEERMTGEKRIWTLCSWCQGSKIEVSAEEDVDELSDITDDVDGELSDEVPNCKCRSKRKKTCKCNGRKTNKHKNKNKKKHRDRGKENKHKNKESKQS